MRLLGPRLPWRVLPAGADPFKSGRDGTGRCLPTDDGSWLDLWITRIHFPGSGDVNTGMFSDVH